MERTTIDKILTDAPGVTRGDAASPTFEAEGEHRISLYLGGQGQSAVVSDLVRVTLQDEVIEVEAKERTLHYLLYGPIVGVSIRRPREEAGRTGF